MRSLSRAPPKEPSPTKVYLDTCSLQRPLDSRTHVRITLEAEAVLGVLTLLEAGEIELVNSDALAFEVSRTPNPTRRRFVQETLRGAETHVTFDDAAPRAQAFVDRGIKPLDALHLASAEAAGAAYFCTCDDKLLKRARAILNLSCKVVFPAELIEELE